MHSQETKVLRRTLSTTSAEILNEKDKKERFFQPDSPIHTAQDSLFSSTSGYTNFRGLLNLCVILLVLSNGRVALENIIKYGILVDPIKILMFFMERPHESPSIVAILIVYAITFVAFLIEFSIVNGILKEGLGVNLAIFNLVLQIAIPATFVYEKDCNPIGGSIALAIASIMFLKMVSYHMVNHWCRKERRNLLRSRSRSTIPGPAKNGEANIDTIDHQTSTPLVQYPNNINIHDFVYFLCAPTLCYELNFPRTSRIRKRFLIKRVVEMMVLMLAIPALIQQWMVPIIENSVDSFTHMQVPKMVERLLKLAVPNHVIWLIAFYGIFHSTLNALGEALMFADRQFYLDWWNSESVEQFWKSWNIPVHRWCLRHLYIPIIKHGYSKSTAAMIVFVVSAFFHEYLVSVPLKMFRCWSFSGMVLQIPFSHFVRRYFRKGYANMAVWVSLIIGQPLAILMYYHDYYVLNYLK